MDRIYDNTVLLYRIVPKERYVDFIITQSKDNIIKNITEKDIEECLRIIKRAPKPVLVHCMHGSDRTGTIVAAYRILEQGWSPDDAIAELKEPRFGYHSNVYPYIPNLLKGIDWKDMKKRLRDNR